MKTQIITDSDKDTEKMIEIATNLVTTNGSLTVLLKNAYIEIAKIENATWADWDNVLASVKAAYKL